MTKLRPLNNVLEAIGDTPLVHLNTIPKSFGIECDMYAKCEWFNAGGSIKDRIGLKMIEEAEKKGILKPGYTIIEPTSGNTGIGLALVGAVKGYRVIITLPEKMSNEKVDVLKALGAEIIRTPTEAPFDSPESHIGVAKRLNKEIPNSVILDQYANPNNPLAHYEGTAQEIYDALGGKVDCFVASAGTGGTLTGTAKKLKEKIPEIKVIGVDPFGSIMARPENINKGGIFAYQIEGIGYDFIPDVLDYNYIDRWEKTNDKESFTMARRLIKEEGLLCGGSSGAAMAAAVKVAKTLKKGDVLVVLFADSVRNYMSKFLRDDWMIENGYIEQTEQVLKKFGDAKVSDLHLPDAITISPNELNIKAIEICNDKGFDQLPVVAECGKLLGTVTTNDIYSKVTSGKITFEDPVSSAAHLYKSYETAQVFKSETSLNELSRYFEKHAVAIITNENNKVIHVVEKIDLIKYLANAKGYSI